MSTYTLDPDIKKFPGGEVHPRPATHCDMGGPTTVRARLTNSDQVMALLMLCDALRRGGELTGKTTLQIPYFPYARQDRVANAGESLSVAVMAGLINALKFDEVHILDPHSDVTSALVNNVRVTHAYQTVMNSAMRSDAVRVACEKGIYVIPDAGAEKKTRAFAREFGNTRPPMQASKVRCTKTGQITETVVYSNGEIYEGPQEFVIVDDICDGGRTFIELAKKLRYQYGVKSLHLHVSHGIFSKGLGPLLEHIDTISTTDSFPQSEHSQLTVLPALWN